MDTNTDRDDLATRFRALSDAELLARCRSGTLNEAAQTVANKELAARGLELPGPVDAADEGAEGDFVAVARFLNPTDAHLVRAVLEGSGIPAVAADANTVQMNLLWAPAVGGVRILVRASRAAEARELIDAFNRGDLALPDDGR